MSVVSLLGVQVLKNPAPFNAPYEFEITFECLEALQKGDLMGTRHANLYTHIYIYTRHIYICILPHQSSRAAPSEAGLTQGLTKRTDLEWNLVYVGSATSTDHDQELDSLLVGPIPIGVNKFIFEAAAPDLKRIPASDILGVTVILLTCAYDGREFVRVGYYVNNEYDSDEMNAEPPPRPVIERVRRNVLAEKPRVTRFTIKWDSEDSAPAMYPPEQPEADLDNEDDDGARYGVEEEEEEAEDEDEEGDEGKALHHPTNSPPIPIRPGEDVEMAGPDDHDLANHTTTTMDTAMATPMHGPPPPTKTKTRPMDEASDAGSEDLEQSSEDDDDDDEEDDAEGDGEADGDGDGDAETDEHMDEDVEMADDVGVGVGGHPPSRSSAATTTTTSMMPPPAGPAARVKKQPPVAVH
ncbi:MAG: Histone chaperone asf1 [Phylliscum demangeonii]|nr:MAG: Histone chaperone asf1 [Phylliscum demangeonii]